MRKKDGGKDRERRIEKLNKVYTGCVSVSYTHLTIKFMLSGMYIVFTTELFMLTE